MRRTGRRGHVGGPGLAPCSFGSTGTFDLGQVLQSVYFFS